MEIIVVVVVVRIAVHGCGNGGMCPKGLNGSNFYKRKRATRKLYVGEKMRTRGYIYIDGCNHSDSMLLPCRAACGQRTVRRRISGIQLNKLAPSSHKTKRTDTIFTNNGIPALIGKF